MRLAIFIAVSLCLVTAAFIAAEKSHKCRDAFGVPIHQNGQTLCLRKELFQELPE